MEVLGAANSGGQNIGERQQAFLIQYTTLMITLLAFVIGSFTGGSMHKNKGAAVIAPAAPETKDVVPALTMSTWRLTPVKSDAKINDMFKSKSVEINPEAAFAIATLLHSHDVFVEFEITWDQCPANEETKCINKAFARVHELEKYLDYAGVAPETYQMFARSQGEAQLVMHVHEQRAEIRK